MFASVKLLSSNVTNKCPWTIHSDPLVACRTSVIVFSRPSRRAWLCDNNKQTRNSHSVPFLKFVQRNRKFRLWFHNPKLHSDQRNAPFFLLDAYFFYPVIQGSRERYRTERHASSTTVERGANERKARHHVRWTGKNTRSALLSCKMITITTNT